MIRELMNDLFSLSQEEMYLALNAVEDSIEDEYTEEHRYV